MMVYGQNTGLKDVISSLCCFNNINIIFGKSTFGIQRRVEARETSAETKTYECFAGVGTTQPQQMSLLIRKLPENQQTKLPFAAHQFVFYFINYWDQGLPHTSAC